MGQLSVPASFLCYITCFGLASIWGKYDLRNKFLKLLLICIPPMILATFRYNVGYDYGSYISGYYNSFGDTYSSIISSYQIGDPIAFSLISKFATSFYSERIYLLILSLLSLVPGMIYIISDWNDNDIQPLMIFVFLFSPFLFSFSACKQGIALSFLMLSLKYVYERKPVKFGLIIGIAFLFHSTSLAFVFIYFFINSRKELSSLKKILIILGCLLVIMNFEYILSNVLQGRYEAYASEIVEGKNRTFWLYSLIAVILLLFDRVLKRLDERNGLLIMMMIVGAMCQYLGFLNAFTKRIGEYFLMAQVFLLPQIPYMFTIGGRRLMKLMILIYIILIFYLTYPVSYSGMTFLPYSYKLY